jgi:cytidylate kinase
LAAEILLIGGQIGSGKTAVAEGLAGFNGVQIVRVRQALADILGGTDWDRAKLQREGAALDQRSAGTWLCRYLQEHCAEKERWVVDSARTRRQVEPVLNEITDSRLVFLSAAETTRRQRFTSSAVADPVKRSMPFDVAMRHGTEREAATIAAMAHLVIETDDMGLDEVVHAIASWMRWS